MIGVRGAAFLSCLDRVTDDKETAQTEFTLKGQTNRQLKVWVKRLAGYDDITLVHFEDGVNLTMGLPIIRTSVDHGTAYDIAGKGLASACSLAASFAMAAQIIVNRKT